MSDSESLDESEPVKRRRPLVAFLPLAVFLLTAGLLYARLFSGDASILPSALIGKPVPRFALPPVAGLDKPGLDAADLEQGGVTLVNVFASWCVPCRQESAALRGLQLQGLRLVGIAYKDKPKNTRLFLNETDDPFARVGADEAGRTAIDFGVYGVPETYVVDGKGIIVAKVVGPLDADNIKSELLPAVAKARQRPASGPPS